ncbi:TetR/AcrR family transcriptional regulator [Proteiniphilum sp. X52]|uniref:TetR/AcrR family transcriptional regulator n=1 Tax=Proteiniphilum sp. X52 TaxID=2382159 RepID=UPI000F09BA17|nr:TetR/AcrR family transcriptional regulator [Proteiniphilum sp. X52]RNC66564.1 TetR/AcrR family transcriptional regulator [Proteiniphilum sp. X52]
MRTNNHTYDTILWECFKLFLHNGYKEVTFADIEKAIGMTRGAVYYYVKDKKTLFHAVINKYLIEKQNISKKVSYNEEEGLRIFILNYVDGVMATRKSFFEVAEQSNAILSYYNLINNALIYYEGFKEKVEILLNHEVAVWEKVLKLSKERGEIKDNIHIPSTALVFQSIFHGYSYTRGMIERFNYNQLLDLYLNFYDQIKA